MYGINWEKSKALTPLKRDILLGLFDHPVKFFLTGGTALGCFYLEHRKSYDMDFFVTSDDEWKMVFSDFLVVIKNIQATARQINLSPSFARYEITRSDEHEIIDFVRETVPQIWPEKNRFGDILVDTPEEITVNKWCALLGRTEVKDLVDLFFLSKHIDIWNLFEKGSRKEGGLDPSTLSFVLSDIKIQELPPFLVSPLSLTDIESFKIKVLDFLDHRSFPET
jgi:hypothetical protein